MKLNPNCIRDLMLFFEEKTYVMNSNGSGGRFHSISPELFCKMEPLNKYGMDEILYHIIQLSESGYIVTDFNFNLEAPASCFNLSSIHYITPKGHEFIASIKEDTRWGKIQKVLGPLGAVSLSVIEAVASGVTGATINHLLGQDQ